MRHDINSGNRLTLVLTLSSVLSVSVQFPAGAGGRPVALEDILLMQDIGAVEVDQHGRHIAFEVIPSAVERRDFSVAETRFSGSTYVLTVGKDETPRNLIAHAGAVGTWLGPFSPGGSRLVVFWREGQKTRTGVYDFDTGNLRQFDFQPRVDFAQSDPVWISDNELVYSTIPNRSENPRVDFRRAAARRLARAWDEAWLGERPTADVISVPARYDSGTNDDGALIRVDVRTGAESQIASGRYVNLTLSPDGRFLAAARRGGFVQLSENLGLYSGQGPYYFAPVLIELKTPYRVEGMCESCDALFSTLRWSTDENHVVFFVRSLDEPWQDGRFVLFDALRRSSSRIVHTGLDLVSQRERGRQPAPEATVPFHGGIAVAARAAPDPLSKPAFSDKRFREAASGRVDWFAIAPDGRSRKLTAMLREVSPVLVDISSEGLVVEADDALWRVTYSGSMKRLTSEHLEGFALLATTADRSSSDSTTIVRATSKRGNEHHLLIVAPDRRGIIDLAIPSHELQAAAVSPNGRTVVYRHVAGTGATMLDYVADGKQHRLWSINEHLLAIEPAREVRVSYQLADGTALTSCALLPSNSKPRGRAAVIVHAYPGPFSRCSRFYKEGIINPYEPELFTTLGYVVLFPSAPEEKLRNSQGPLGNWAGVALPALDALDHAGYADSSRAGVFGLSYGAISALALLTQTDRFKAAVASHGAANFSSHYGTLGLVRRLLPDDLFAIGQSVSYESRGSFLWLGAPPWEAPDAYVRASPYFDVDAIRTPLLLMHSDLDWNYQMDQFDQVFTALFRLGREAEYVRYWGEGHGLASPANLRDMWSRLESWYSSRLQSSENGSASDNSRMKQ